MGYHTKEIKKGEFGEFSKVVEEIEELIDAHKQGVKIMELLEFSDLLGSIEAYTLKKYNINLQDIVAMRDRTKSAFEEGQRK